MLTIAASTSTVHLASRLRSRSTTLAACYASSSASFSACVLDHAQPPWSRVLQKSFGLVHPAHCRPISLPSVLPLLSIAVKQRKLPHLQLIQQHWHQAHQRQLHSLPQILAAPFPTIDPLLSTQDHSFSPQTLRGSQCGVVCLSWRHQLVSAIFQKEMQHQHPMCA